MLLTWLFPISIQKVKKPQHRMVWFSGKFNFDWNFANFPFIACVALSFVYNIYLLWPFSCCCCFFFLIRKLLYNETLTRPAGGINWKKSETESYLRKTHVRVCMTQTMCTRAKWKQITDLKQFFRRIYMCEWVICTPRHFAILFSVFVFVVVKKITSLSTYHQLNQYVQIQMLISLLLFSHLHFLMIPHMN